MAPSNKQTQQKATSSKQLPSWLKSFNEAAEKRSWLVYLWFIFISLLVFQETIGHDFVNFDDNKVIFNTNVVMESDNPIGNSFSRGLYTGHYKPLTYLTWWTEYQFFGKSPGVFHFNNLLLHILNVFLIFFIGRIILPKLKLHASVSLFGAIILASIFAIHPLHVESVAWAVERKDVLFSFFFLSAWLIYLKYLKEKTPILIVIVALLYMASMLSKATGITLITVLFLSDFLYERSDYKKVLLEKVPVYLSLGIGAFLFGLFGDTLLQNGNLAATITTGEIAQGTNPGNNLLAVITIQSTKILLWIAHILFPIKLSVVYSGNVTMAAVGYLQYFSPLLVIGLLFVAYKTRETRKEIAFGLLFFLTTLSPALVFSLKQGIGIFLSNRYTYIPLFGILVIIIVSLLKSESLRRRSWTLVFFTAVMLAFSFLSFSAVKHWRNSETLWTNVIEISPDNSIAYAGRGRYFMSVGENEKALADLNTAIEKNPNNTNAHFNKTVLSISMQHYDEALKSVNNFITLEEQRWKGLEKRAYIYSKLGEPRLATIDINEAIAAKPTKGDLYLVKADILIGEGELDLALQNVNESIRLSPDYWVSFQKQALILDKQNRLKDALVSINNAIDKKPDEAILYSNKGAILYNSNQIDEAITAINQALAIDPEFAPALNSKLIFERAVQKAQTSSSPVGKDEEAAPDLYQQYKAQAKQFKEAGNTRKAIEYFTKCIELAPDLFSNYLERGLLRLNTNEPDLALSDISTGMAKNPSYPDAILFRSMAYNNLKQYKNALNDAKAAKAKGVEVDPAYIAKLEADVKRQ